MRKGTVIMPMTLEQIDAKLKECENHNTQLTTRRAMYAERLQKEFGVATVDELKTLLEQVEVQLKQKQGEYDAALAEAENLLRKAGVAC